MNVDAALEVFASVPKIRKIMQTLHDVGLGYLPLGQSAPTLSGGEAQRVKLAAELARPDTGKTLYVLDEPTTGLHIDDVRKLLGVVHRLADLGNTVVIIEHNLEVIKTADWLIDIGPEAGEEGGEIVAAGPPELIAKARKSLTGAILKNILDAGPFEERPRFDPKAAAKKIVDEAKAAKEKEGPDNAKAPWEVDGRRWHTVERVGRSGKPARWNGLILEKVVDRLEQIGGFPAVNWTERAIVKVPGVQPDHPPFLQAQTGHEWVLTLRFTVKRNAFKLETLARQLQLAPFHEARKPVLSDAERITLNEPKGLFQEVILTCHTLEELATDAFDAFLVKAAVSYQNAIKSEADEEAEAAVAEETPGWKVVTKTGVVKKVKT
jgi:excinuclease ABC subunit A